MLFIIGKIEMFNFKEFCFDVGLENNFYQTKIFVPTFRFVAILNHNIYYSFLYTRTYLHISLKYIKIHKTYFRHKNKLELFGGNISFWFAYACVC